MRLRRPARDLPTKRTPGVRRDDAGRGDAIVGLELPHSLGCQRTEVAGGGLDAETALHDGNGLTAIGFFEHRYVARAGRPTGCLGRWGFLDLGGLTVDKAVGGV